MIGSPAQILLVADDGPEFGLGHIRRLEYLIQALGPELRKNSFVLSRETYPPGFPTRNIVSSFSKQVCDAISAMRPALCIFDLSYTSWVDEWPSVASRIPSDTITIGVDVPPGWIENFDHVIHPGISPSEEFKRFANWHGGPEWVLADRFPRWNPKPGPPRVVVTTGSQAFGAFYHWLLPQLKVLAQERIEVSWVIGRHDKTWIEKVHTSDGGVSFVSDLDLEDRFANANVVLARFGVTAFELIGRGIPTVVLPGWALTEDNEVFELDRKGVALVVGTESEVSDSVLKLIHDLSLQESLSRAGSDLFRLNDKHPASSLISQLIFGPLDV